MSRLTKDWVRRSDYDKLKQDYAHSQEELKRLKDMIEPLPFAAKANGVWNGDMLHDWIEAEPPENSEHRKLYRAIWSYRESEFEKGIVEGIRRTKVGNALVDWRNG